MKNIKILLNFLNNNISFFLILLKFLYTIFDSITQTVKKDMLCHSRVGGHPITKKSKHTRFLNYFKLKARFISLFSGFPPTRE
ncbi:hypothetical protein MCC_04295 [Rickettsia rhipicephali str. 3-7-female6-CWPP]|uniref:Uncharacterized protein n=1 Tax=Rickettsia rhipicephali (strain 3-7-female6-CWPP) TaxID=1105113 RepID=A0AAI8AA61_RICR3|nr:hypothetical protein MCC_04295 [Rickettsia rhipicephali str. 3-7-female6-CWPP]